jgi:hypothetical protein
VTALDFTELQRRASGPTPCKVYRRHNCSARHRTARTMAKCVWRRAGWINWVDEDCQFALVAYCSVTTVTLWPTYEEAARQMEFLNQWRCGHACHGAHEVVKLVLP